MKEEEDEEVEEEEDEEEGEEERAGEVLQRREAWSTVIARVYR